jgi:hypothetical protein
VEEILTSMVSLNFILSSQKIDEIAYNVEIKLCDILKITKFSPQLDNSTLK